MTLNVVGIGFLRLLSIVTSPRTHAAYDMRRCWGLLIVAGSGVRETKVWEMLGGGGSFVVVVVAVVCGGGGSVCGGGVVSILQCQTL